MNKEVTNVDRYKRIVKLQDKAFADNNTTIAEIDARAEQLAFLWDEMTEGEQNEIMKFLEKRLQ